MRKIVASNWHPTANANYNEPHKIRDREFTVAQMPATSQVAFIPLPPYRYDTSHTHRSSVSNFSLVRFDANLYSVPSYLAMR